MKRDPGNEDWAMKMALMIQGETMFTPEECRALYRLARTVSGRWVELGSWCGRSFMATAMGLGSDSELISVDLFLGRLNDEDDWYWLAPTPRWVSDHFQATLHACEDLRPGCRFRSLRMDTQAAAAEFRDASVDGLFIDADHRYERVKGDIQAWLPKLKPGGLLSGHDYWSEHSGVVQAVDEIFHGRHQVIPNTRIWYVRA